MYGLPILKIEVRFSPRFHSKKCIAKSKATIQKESAVFFFINVRVRLLVYRYIYECVIRVCSRVCMRVYGCPYVCACLCVCVLMCATCVYECVYTCVPMCMCACVCVRLCVCLLVGVGQIYCRPPEQSEWDRALREGANDKPHKRRITHLVSSLGPRFAIATRPRWVNLYL
jgi:hypothetical protein